MPEKLISNFPKPVQTLLSRSFPFNNYPHRYLKNIATSPRTQISERADIKLLLASLVAYLIYSQSSKTCSFNNQNYFQRNNYKTVMARVSRTDSSGKQITAQRFLSIRDFSNTGWIKMRKFKFKFIITKIRHYEENQPHVHVVNV